MNSNFDQVIAMLGEQAKASGHELKHDVQKIRLYMRQRAAYLMALSSQKGYMDAIRLEARNVVLYALEVADDQAQKIDNRIFAIVEGALAAVV